MLRAGWAEFEAKVARERAAVEDEARSHADEDDRHGAALLVSDFMDRTVTGAIERAESLREQLRSG